MRKIRDPLNATEVLHRTFVLAEALIAEYRMQLTDPDLIIDVQTGLAAWNFLAVDQAIHTGYETAWAELQRFCDN